MCAVAVSPGIVTSDFSGCMFCLQEFSSLPFALYSFCIFGTHFQRPCTGRIMGWSDLSLRSLRGSGSVCVCELVLVEVHRDGPAPLFGVALATLFACTRLT